MKTDTIPDQKIVVAVGLNRNHATDTPARVVVHVAGCDRFRNLAEEFKYDFLWYFFEEDDLPKGAGVYLWYGAFTVAEPEGADVLVNMEAETEYALTGGRWVPLEIRVQI